MEKQNFMCIIVFVDGETNILQVCEGHNSFFSSKTQEKILFDDMSQNKSVVSFSIKTVWLPKLGSGLMVSGVDLKFTFYSKIFSSL